ncbi:MAG: DUF87 domain-containing protein [Anaerolineaceae bacterium]|nr:DUF87 domain-containing protein [Anaerolineaceae bacterium]MCB9101806.1 DUF87 domain-containing protein [Anaerolineales bacterium]
MQAPPEKLGSFFLGAEYDLAGKQRLDVPVSYDARDLTTHGVCVGMTGSGKTGLCIGLLEEAAIDKIPTLMIDPKGDITNLLLQFPDLRPEDFEPWVNVDDARRKGRTVAEHAAATAEMWRDGLADWGQGPERLRLLQESGDYTIFTPGSDAGVSVNILGSLAAPQLDFDSNAELIRERIGGTVAAMLSLANLKVDPVRSREAILLSNIFEHFWKQGEDLDLAKLITSIQTPPVRQMGVFDVDTFFPEANRFELAMAFNTLVASPTFAAWLQGEPLDIDALMYTADGQPRHAIFYIAHLSDSERMFFVTLLLENLLTWMRRQPGTTSLRALLYFDEIFGFFPPTAEPPSKRPLLTLLKQARAFGLGAVLVTQNPVDLDYKGLTNAGTWFIGKLQAERDKARVLEGLKGAIAEAGGRGENVDFDTILSQLGSRVFLLHNVHADGPVVFQTRWALSYLRGPLTKPQVRQLMADRTATPATPAAPAPAPVTIDSPAPTASAPDGYSAHAPSLSSAVPQAFLPIEVSEQAAVRRLGDEQNPVTVDKIELIYEPAFIGSATVRFVDTKYQVNSQTDQTLVARVAGGLRGVEWNEAETLSISTRELQSAPESLGEGQGPYFASLPEDMNTEQEIKGLKQSLSDWLYYNSRYPLFRHESLKAVQQADEDERAFKIRVQQLAREARDDEVDKLEEKYAKSLDRLNDKLRKKEMELSKDEAKYTARQREEMAGIGESVLGFFFGRRRTSLISGAMNKRRITGQAKYDVEETQAEIEDIKEEIAKIKQELEEASAAISTRWDETAAGITTVEIKPRRSDVEVSLAGVGWLPHWRVSYRDGETPRKATVEAYKGD